jgi:phage terminase small subunit
MPALANAKHEAVAIAYIADPERIGWRAYCKVYPKSSQPAAEAAFSRLLRNAKFSVRVAELAEVAAQGAVASAHEVLVELSRIARANIADFMRAFFGCDDPVAAIDQLTPAQTAALVEVTVEQFTDGRGERAREVRRIRFKLVSKIDALELLGKHHKLYIDRVEHEYGRVGLADRLAAALARVEERAQNTDGEVRSDRRQSRSGAAPIQKVDSDDLIIARQRDASDFFGQHRPTRNPKRTRSLHACSVTEQKELEVLQPGRLRVS